MGIFDKAKKFAENIEKKVGNLDDALKKVGDKLSGEEPELVDSSSTEGTYKDGKQDGLFTSWHDNGKKESEINYKDGKQDGLYTFWYENGNKEFEGTHNKDEKEDGLWTRWYENGQKSNEQTYKDGKIDGLEIQWHENGQKSGEGTFKDGKQDGKWTHWFSNGQKSSEGNSKDGKFDGLYTRWHENGQKKEEGTYKDGEYEGKQIWWDEDGNEIKWEFYKDGKLIDSSMCHAIIDLLKTRGVKMPASDIDAFLKHQNVDEVKVCCEDMYHNGKINRTANYRYFILTEEQEKPKKVSAPKSETVDVKAELKKYKEMLDDGLISQEQYDAKSNELLGL